MVPLISYTKDLSARVATLVSVGAGGTAVNYATRRHDSYDPVFSANGDEIAFISDRNSCLSARNSLRFQPMRACRA